MKDRKLWLIVTTSVVAVLALFVVWTQSCRNRAFSLEEQVSDMKCDKREGVCRLSPLGLPGLRPGGYERKLLRILRSQWQQARL